MSHVIPVVIVGGTDGGHGGDIARSIRCRVPCARPLGGRVPAGGAARQRRGDRGRARCPSAGAGHLRRQDFSPAHSVEANYVLGCDGANSVVRTAIGSAMKDFKFQQRWLAVDVDTTADLRQWDGVHQVCHPHRGRLCPNPVLAEGNRFDTVVGSSFAVVVSVSLTSSRHEELTRRGAVAVSAEPGTELARWLAAGGATIAVVRPDRTVLCAGRDVDAVCRHVPTFTPARATADA